MCIRDSFYTIKLASPVNITAGERFSVVLRLAASFVTNPIPVEYAKEGYTSKATAAPGQSFMSEDGNTWTDATTKDKTANVCLKAYSGGGTPLRLDIKANGSDGPITVTPNDPVAINISIDPGDRNGQLADWWIAAKTPFSPPVDWCSYGFSSGWLPGIYPYVQAEVLPVVSREVLNSPLPLGNYTFYFALDDPDGKLTGPLWGIDSVDVKVE